jgi:hypothetical protein
MINSVCVSQRDAPYIRAVLLMTSCIYVVTLAACSAPDKPPTKPTPTTGWQRAWLRQESCRAPCLDGVTPGQTTEEQAVAIWKKSPLFGAGDVQTMSFKGRVDMAGTFGDEIYAHWLDNTDNGEMQAEVSKDSPHTVTGIRVGFYRQITLGEVIEAYGEPSHIEAIAYIGGVETTFKYFNVSLLYKPQGMEDGGYGAYGGSKEGTQANSAQNAVLLHAVGESPSSPMGEWVATNGVRQL